MNTQKPEARVKGDGLTLDFHSMFFTIQGEGPFAGHRSVFVRLAGCNLQCPGCDTEYTQGRELWDARHLAIATRELADRNGASCCLVVITGGEPLRQNLGEFVCHLITMGHHIQIESNGMFAPDSYTMGAITSGAVDLVVSPKTARIHPWNELHAKAFKYVIDHRSVDPDDGLPILALEHPNAGRVARPFPGTRNSTVYVNPYDAGSTYNNERNLSAAAESAKKHGYILGVQLHKLAGLE